MAHKVSLVHEKSGTSIDLDGEDEILWVFETGGNSPRVPIRLSSSVDEQVRALGAFDSTWSLVFKPQDARGLIVSGLYLIERQRSVGPNRILWYLVDARYNLRDIMVDTMFNLMRAQNSKIRPGQQVGRQLVDPNVAAFVQMPKDQFVFHTCKVQGRALNNSSFADGSNDSFQPWTALQGLVWLCSNGGFLNSYNTLFDGRPDPNPIPALDGKPFQFGRLLVAKNVKDNKNILKSFNPRTRWPDAVNILKRRARVHVFIAENGDVVIQSSDPALANPALQQYGKFEGSSGVPIFSSLLREAPRVARVYFPTFEEVRWDFDDEEFQRLYSGAPTKDLVYRQALNVPRKDIFFLENVAKVPQDTLNYQKGQWAPFPFILDDWKRDIPNLPQNTAFPNPEQVFNYSTIRRYILSTSLAHHYQRDRLRQEFRNPVAEARVASVYENFRSTLRIPEVWLDHIEDWSPELGIIFSTAARARQPSPVWVDHFAWDSYILRPDETDSSSPNIQPGQGYVRNNPLGGATERLGLKGGNLAFGINARPPFKSVWDLKHRDMVLSPGRVVVADERQGVMGIEFPPDLRGMTESYSLGLFEPRSIPTHSVSPIIRGGIKFIGAMSLLPTYRFSTILAIKWRSPNNPSRFFHIQRDGRDFLGGAEALGPRMDIFFPGFEAFRAHEDGRVKWNFDPDRGALFIDHKGSIENVDALREITDGELREVYFRHLPRILGIYRAKGWTGQFPIGHIERTSATFRRGAMETEVSAEAEPVGVDAYEIFSPYTRDIVARLQEGSSKTV